MALTFGGIEKLQAVGGGCLKASWSAASGGSVESYNIYISTSAITWASSELLVKIRGSLLAFLIRVLPDGDTLLQEDTSFYVGVRAEEVLGVEDLNIETLIEEITGSGSSVQVSPDRQIAKVI